jgi:hypothetical protein
MAAIHAEDAEGECELALIDVFHVLGEQNDAKLRAMNPRLRNLYLLALLTRRLALNSL